MRLSNNKAKERAAEAAQEGIGAKRAAPSSRDAPRQVSLAQAIPRHMHGKSEAIFFNKTVKAAALQDVMSQAAGEIAASPAVLKKEAAEAAKSFRRSGAFLSLL